MTKLKYIFLLSAFAILTFSSCGDGSFSQVVTIEIPDHDPLPVVLLQVEAEQERQLSALVSNSKGILDPESTYEIPEDADLKLYREGNLYAEFDYFDDVLRYEYFSNDPFPTTPGETWRLEAVIPGFNPVAVEQVMPSKPIIENATYEAEGTIDSEGFRVDEITVDVKDADPGQINYYGLTLWQIFVSTNSEGDTLQVSRGRINLDSNDPLLSYGGRYDLVFTDEGFSNDEYQLRTYTYFSLDNEDSTLEVIVHQLTEDAWLYARSLEQYNNAIDNPFAEPVTVHSNVEGGFGVFTVTNTSSFFIE
ncbi:MAG: DUF4249 domain-containing protein [Bacteroidota bacterium]